MGIDEDRWARPQIIDDLTLAFPINIMGKFCPRPIEIPAGFKKDHTISGKWFKFQSDWFFGELKNLRIVPKPGIDPDRAMIHLTTIQSSFEPAHQEKELAVAYLAYLWFDDVKYDVDNSRRKVI